MPTLDRFKVVTFLSTFFSLVLSLAIAWFGYFAFGSLTQSNILNNFNHGFLDLMFRLAYFYG
jgi:amino acid permease